MWVSDGAETGGRVRLEFASGESGGLGLVGLEAKGRSAEADFGDAESGASHAAGILVVSCSLGWVEDAPRASA